MLFRLLQNKFWRMQRSIIVQLPWNLQCKDSWMRNNYSYTNRRKEDSSRINSGGRSITFQPGSGTPNGNKAWSNLPGPDLSMKGPCRCNTRTKVYGSSTLRWRWKISLLTTPEMCGKEPLITCPEKTSSGSNTHTCNKLSASSKKPEMCSRNGCNGSQDRRLGWRTSSSKKEWANLRRPKLSSTNIFKLTLPYPLI